MPHGGGRSFLNGCRMMAVLLIFAVIVLLVAGTSWRLATQRVRPGLPDLWPAADYGDQPHVAEFAPHDAVDKS
jgi:hypothetical protein